MFLVDLYVSFSHYVCNGSPGTCCWLPAGRCAYWVLRWPQNCCEHRPEWPSFRWQLVIVHAHLNTPYVYMCVLPVLINSLQLNSVFVFSSFRWSGFLLCAIAMLLVIFPMFAFPKKLPPRHKKRKRKKKMGSPGDVSSDDDAMKEKSSSKGQSVSSSMGFGKDIKGEKGIISLLDFDVK